MPPEEVEEPLEEIAPRSPGGEGRGTQPRRWGGTGRQGQGKLEAGQGPRGGVCWSLGIRVRGATTHRRGSGGSPWGGEKCAFLEASWRKRRKASLGALRADGGSYHRLARGDPRALENDE